MRVVECSFMQVDVAIKKLKMVAPEADLRQPWISEIEILQVSEI